MGELVATQGLTNTSVPAPKDTPGPTVKSVSGLGAKRAPFLLFLSAQLKYT